VLDEESSKKINFIALQMAKFFSLCMTLDEKRRIIKFLLAVDACVH
jgi:hypothetical protein